MADKLERIYTIPLGKVYSKARTKRASKAINLIKEFAAKHMKSTVGAVRISKGVNSTIWQRGIQKPPRRIKVKLLKEEELLKVLLVDEEWQEVGKLEIPEKEIKQEPKKEKPELKEEPKKEEPKKEEPKKEEPKKEEPKKEEPKKEEPKKEEPKKEEPKKEEPKPAEVGNKEEDTKEEK